MKIQTALIINSLASLLLIIVWVPLSSVARDNFNIALEQQINAKDVLESIVELNEATRNLAIEVTLETEHEWRRQYDLASIRLTPQYFDGETSSIILREIKEDFVKLGEHMQEFITQSEIAGPTTQDEQSLTEKLNQMSLLSHDLLQQTILFSELRQNQLTGASDSIDVYRTTTIIGAFIAISLINFLIYRSMSVPIRKLTMVSSKISRGELDVSLEEDDLPMVGEFGELSRAFIKMTKQLNNLYSSLETKVEKKTEALSTTIEEMEEEKERFESQVIETEKFKKAVDASTDGMMIVRMDGEVVYANQAWSSISGYPSQELMGKNIRHLVDVLPDEQIYDRIWKAMVDTQDITVDEVVNRKKQGEFYQAQISAYPIKEDNKPVYYVCIQQDITKRKEVDRAKTEFVSLASHQLRTPLSTIGWYTEMLMSGDAGQLTEDQKNFLKEIFNSNKRMVDLVNALLNVSRIEMGTFSVEAKWSNIIEICESVIGEMQHQLDAKHQELHTDYDMRIPDIKTDPKLMRIVFQNLISNAVKYTPEGGKITVAVKADSDDNAAIGGGEMSVSGIIITVSDTGMGIPGRQQAQIFQKLFRADNVKEKDTEGTGLGLYLVKSIVDYSGGNINFVSSENEGTTFTIKLPIEGMQSKEGTKEIISDIAETAVDLDKPSQS